MRNKSISNMAILIVVVTLLTAISVITYMGVKTYRISSDAKLLNAAVQTVSNIGEIGSDSTSKEDFFSKLNEAVDDLDINGNRGTAIFDNGITVKVKVTSETKDNGIMLKYSIIAENGDDKIYILKTEKYVSKGRQGDN